MQEAALPAWAREVPICSRPPQLPHEVRAAQSQTPGPLPASPEESLACGRAVSANSRRARLQPQKTVAAACSLPRRWCAPALDGVVCAIANSSSRSSKAARSKGRLASVTRPVEHVLIQHMRARWRAPLGLDSASAFQYWPSQACPSGQTPNNSGSMRIEMAHELLAQGVKSAHGSRYGTGATSPGTPPVRFPRAGQCAGATPPRPDRVHPRTRNTRPAG